jgi:4,5-dihydroxyphthalate decarboxylase
MLLDDDLAAVVGADLKHPDVVPLLPDADERALQRFLADGVLPINHLVVVRDDILKEHPTVGADLFDAFARSKQRYVSRLVSGDEPVRDGADELHLRLIGAGVTDCLPYGIAPNLPTLESLMRHARDQHILRDEHRIEDLFDPATLGLIG